MRGLIGRRHLTGMRRLVRFTLVGALCAALSNVLVIVLVGRGFGVLAASALAFLPVLVCGFALHSCFTFDAPPTRGAFVRYTLAMAANFPLWSAGLVFFCDLLRVPIALAAPATTVLVFAWNYGTARWAFGRRSARAAASALER